MLLLSACSRRSAHECSDTLYYTVMLIVILHSALRDRLIQYVHVVTFHTDVVRATLVQYVSHPCTNVKQLCVGGMRVNSPENCTGNLYYSVLSSVLLKYSVRSSSVF